MPDIRHAIVIDAALPQILPLIATSQGLTEWWAADVTEDRATGIVELGFFKRATIYRLEPVRNTPPGEVSWLCKSGKEWEGTKLRFQMTPSNKSTQLKFAHAGWASETDYFISCNTTWGELMFRLKAAAEGNAPGPLFSADGMAY